MAQQWFSYTEESLVVAHLMRLDVPVVPIWRWRPRGFLESCWSSAHVGIPKKLLLLVKKSRSNGIDKLARRNEGRQATANFLLLHSFICHQEIKDSDCVFLLQIIWSRKLSSLHLVVVDSTKLSHHSERPCLKNVKWKQLGKTPGIDL